MKTPQPWNDQKIEQIVGDLLRTGVMLSAAVVLIGGSIYLFRHGREPVGYQVFHGEPAEYKTIAGILHGVATLRGRGFIQLGLLLLIATPVARVAFAAWGFAAEKDKNVRHLHPDRPGYSPLQPARLRLGILVIAQIVDGDCCRPCRGGPFFCF